MEGGKGPRGLEKSILVPLHKKNERENCDNYREISLLSVPGKVVCLVVLNRLLKVLNQLQETPAMWLMKSFFGIPVFCRPDKSL